MQIKQSDHFTIEYIAVKKNWVAKKLLIFWMSR